MSTEARDFLVELGTEELPPKALPELERAFCAGVTSGLDAAGLAHGDIESFATPRRLAVWVKALGVSQPEQIVKRKGPPVSSAFDASGQPTRAATAFAESCGTSVDALERVKEGKGEFLYFNGRKPGAATATLLPGIVQIALEKLPIPKRMRWGAGDAEFVRPVHWLVLLHGSDVVPARILDTNAGRATRGHRFMAPAAIELANPAEYETTLRERGQVIARFADRRERIRAGVEAAGRAAGGRALLHDALLDEVTALVEWPVPVTGRFDAPFLELPREVLVSTLEEHQRYFAVEDEQGQLTPSFITVSNIESRDPAKVRAGNERVVRPRLSDAQFFFGQDRKRPLAALRPGLDAVTFQAKLGSIGAKVERIDAIAARIGARMSADVAAVKRCAQLAKCDLLSTMVGEFPELQGTMGAYYAVADGEAAEVAAGIGEHYRPRGGGDALPVTVPGTAVALADKLDTLAGIFSLGQKPTGTKDPFGLRRAAIGVLRILIEKRIDLDLHDLVQFAVSLQPVQSPDATAEVLKYILDRLSAYYLEPAAGRETVAVSVEMLDAVLAAGATSPLDIDERLQALAAFLALPDASSLAAANKRIANILRKAETQPGAVDPQSLREPAEKALYDEVVALEPRVRAASADRRYTDALRSLATLRPAVDAFFDGVMVMDPDATLRANRLALLAGLRSLFADIADLSRLPG